MSGTLIVKKFTIMLQYHLKERPRFNDSNPCQKCCRLIGIPTCTKCLESMEKIVQIVKLIAYCNCLKKKKKINPLILNNLNTLSRQHDTSEWTVCPCWTCIRPGHTLETSTCMPPWYPTKN